MLMSFFDLLSKQEIMVAGIISALADTPVRPGFVDCAVLAVTERLGEPKVATLDRRHFGVMRPRHVDALELLPT